MGPVSTGFLYVHDNCVLGAPAEALAIQASKVDDPIYHRSCHCFNGGWAAIKRRRGRTDDTTGEGNGFHIADMYQVVRRFPQQADELTPFFQYHIGGPCNQVVGNATGDAAQRTSTARCNNHGIELP